MNNNSDTAAHMSYSANGNGIGMAANHIVGGLSIWTNFSSSNFENDQTFTSVRFDSNNYDGDASAVTIGLDKRLGNILIGLLIHLLILILIQLLIKVISQPKVKQLVFM